MKVLKNTLEIQTETWDDPGDYPSNAGSGPLPSYDYVEEISGKLVIELEAEDLECPKWIWKLRTLRDMWLNKNFCEDYIEDQAHDELPSEVNSVSWNIERVGHIVTLTVDSFECDVPDPDDYFECERDCYYD